MLWKGAKHVKQRGVHAESPMEVPDNSLSAHTLPSESQIFGPWSPMDEVRSQIFGPRDDTLQGHSLLPTGSQVLGHENVMEVPDDSLPQDSCLPINGRCAESDEFSESEEEEDTDAELQTMTKAQLYHALGTVLSDIDKTTFDLKAALLNRGEAELALTQANSRVDFLDTRIRRMTNFTVKLQHHISRSDGRRPAAMAAASATSLAFGAEVVPSR